MMAGVGWAIEEGGGVEKRKKVFVPQLEVGRFAGIVKGNGERFGDFNEVCRLPEAVEGRVGFLHQS